MRNNVRAGTRKKRNQKNKEAHERFHPIKKERRLNVHQPKDFVTKSESGD